MTDERFYRRANRREVRQRRSQLGRQRLADLVERINREPDEAIGQFVADVLEIVLWGIVSVFAVASILWLLL